MKILHPRLRTRLHNGLLFLSAVVGVAGGAATHADAKSAEEQLRADCRSEGEAVGLQGSDLEQFIRDCIAEFNKATLINVEK
ncbi:MAG: hypothetical protein H6959_08550 [Chromatiaceae bacterium]|nr:hypothetical protein [Gammaproteobacteria bacterium]MCP5422958.1 hypothetical protein [Chromatiaceae bacterium]